VTAARGSGRVHMGVPSGARGAGHAGIARCGALAALALGLSACTRERAAGYHAPSAAAGMGAGTRDGAAPGHMSDPVARPDTFQPTRSAASDTDSAARGTPGVASARERPHPMSKRARDTLLARRDAAGHLRDSVSDSVKAHSAPPEAATVP